jgi:prevent-host-death family protein
MKELSASEVARHFSTILDGAENGEVVVITRGGRRVAMLLPAPRANGAALLDVFRRWTGRVPLTDTVDTAAAADRGGDAWPG